MGAHIWSTAERLQFGYLFGGNLLKWVDENAWIAASLEYPDCHFVTIGLDRVEFRRSAMGGSILKFMVSRIKQGTTSVQYSVKVFRGPTAPNKDNQIFSTNVTFVRIDDQGNKISLPGR